MISTHFFLNPSKACPFGLSFTLGPGFHLNPNLNVNLRRRKCLGAKAPVQRFVCNLAEVKKTAHIHSVRPILRHMPNWVLKSEKKSLLTPFLSTQRAKTADVPAALLRAHPNRITCYPFMGQVSHRLAQSGLVTCAQYTLRKYVP